MSEILIRKQPSRWRVRRAIIRKEIFNVLQHNYYLFSLLMPLFMSLVFAIMFSALESTREIRVLIYDEGNSSLAAALVEHADITVTHSVSEADLRSELDEFIGGIIIPADYDTTVANGRQPNLTIITNIDGRSTTQANMQKIVQEQLWLSRYAEAPANIEWQDYSKGSDAFAAFTNDNFLLLTLLVLAIAMAGSIVLPQLLVEEKEKATLPVLLATPARYTDLLIGKATAVFFISLVLGTVIIFLNSGFVGDWPITILATLIMIIFTIGVGILFGTWVDSQTHCSEYSVILMIVLNIPVWFTAVPSELLPPLLQVIIKFIPTTYYLNVMLHSLTGLATPAQIGPDLLILCVITLVIFGLIWWRNQQRPYQLA